MNGSKFKKIVGLAADWILDHTKIVMPLILILCVLMTIVIALNANERAKLEQEAKMLEASVVETDKTKDLGSITIPDIPLEQNLYPEVNELMERYYSAIAEGDIDTALVIDEDLDDLARIRIQELGKYIDHYESLDVYTKAGLTKDSYVTYVYAQVQFKDVETLVPGFQTFYVARNEAGNLVIKKNDLDSSIYDYVKAVSLQDDVVDLNNKIAVAYNDLLASDKVLEEYVAYMGGKINEEVGVVLAQLEQAEKGADPAESPEAPVTEAGETSGDSGQTDTPEQPDVTAVRQAKATDVVNIRSSDSETADKLGKAEIGQEFNVLEQKGNGWSRVKYQDGEAYMKSAYLEMISEEVLPPEDTASVESASGISANGTVTVKESVRVRGSASTEGEVLGTVYGGDKLDLIEQKSNGWTKVKYQGKVGYVKSDYVE